VKDLRPLQNNYCLSVWGYPQERVARGEELRLGIWLVNTLGARTLEFNDVPGRRVCKWRILL